MALNERIQIVFWVAWEQSAGEFDGAKRLGAEIDALSKEGLFQEGLVETGVVGHKDTTFQHLVDAAG